MAEVGEAVVSIGLRLRFVLFGLECVLGVSCDGCECERIFRDAREDMVSSKQYRLYHSARLTISGRVGEYEPETICLRVEGRAGVARILQRVVAESEYHAFRMRNDSQMHETGEPDTEPH